jgi:hypothetical protein
MHYLFSFRFSQREPKQQSLQKMSTIQSLRMKNLRRSMSTIQSVRMKNLRRSILVLSLLFFLDTIPPTRGDDSKVGFQDDDIPIFETNPPTITPTFQPSLSPSSAHPTKSHLPTKTPVSTPSYFPSTVNGKS